MNDQEQTKLMVQNLVQKFDEHCSYVKTELATIKRGVYGDPDNKVPGLMDRQVEDERRITALEEEQKKQRIQKKTAMWVLGIVATAVQAVGITIYEFIKSLK